MASYKNKSKPQLINEIESLQKRVNELEESETEFFWAKKKLKKQEEQLRAVLDNATIHIWAFDGEWYYYLSKEWYRYTGQDPALPLTIERWTEAVHPDDLDEAVKTWFKAWENKSNYNGYYRISSAKGKYRLFHSHAVPVYDEKGNLLHYQGYNVDITDQKQAEEALQESEKKLRDLANLLPQIIYETDIKGNLTFINKQAFESFGYSKVEYKKGINVMQTIIPEDRDRVKENIHNILQGKSVGKPEYTALRKDGSTFPIIIYSNAILKNNKPVGLRGIIVDITERKQAEERLHQSEEKLRTLYDSSSDAIMLLDEKGFFDCNNATLQLFGCASREEFCSRHPADFSPSTQPNGTNSMSYASNNIAVALKEGKKRFEHLHCRLDGTCFPAEVLLNAMVLNGKKVLQARVYDITERKQAEERLHQSEEKFRNLTENMFDIVYSMDINGVLTYISPQTKRYGIDPEKLISKNLLEIIHPKDREKLGMEFRKTFETGKEFPSTFRVLDAKGDIHWFEDIGKIQHDKNGNITGIAGVLRNVTASKKAEEALRVSEERFRQLAETSEEWIWEVDDNALFTYASPVVKKLLGYKPEELVGKKHSYDLFHPEEIEPLKKATLELFAKKKPLFRFLNRNVHKNGQIVWLSTSGVPIIDNKGNLLGYRGADIDVTKQKKAEEELKKYREHLEKLVNERTKELEEKNKKLEEFNSLFVGREFRIKELKDKVKEFGERLKIDD